MIRVSFYGHWPLSPSRRWKGEDALTCPKCKSQNISLITEPGALGTGPNGRWRMGDQGGRELAKCEDCGEKGYHKGIPKAGDLAVGTKLAISACGCIFEVAGRDPEPRYHSHVIFKQVRHCKKSCDMNKNQELWLFEDKPIAGEPGRHSFILTRETL